MHILYQHRFAFSLNRKGCKKKKSQYQLNLILRLFKAGYFYGQLNVVSEYSICKEKTFALIFQQDLIFWSFKV